MSERASRNWGLDLVRVTEAAARAAGRWMGLGKRDDADMDAIGAMATAFSTLDIAGHIVVGEEGKFGVHSALESGRAVGTGAGPAMDVVVDPIDGRNLLAQGHPGAIAVAAVAPRGAMWSPSSAVYMDKIVVGRDAASTLVAECMDAPAAWTVKALGGAILGRLAPQSEAERTAIAAAELDTKRILSGDELIAGEQVFFAATGITDGPLLTGVRYHGARAETHSLILRADTGSRRVMYAEHVST